MAPGWQWNDARRRSSSDDHISMLLTVIAGLLPSRIAALKDPVEALRTE